jgi:uncharacterized protein (DUF924 family)
MDISMTEIHPEAKAVLDFWFVDHGSKDWYSGSQRFDVELRIVFAPTLKRAECSELWQWRSTPQGRLAEIIVLDQFSRQLYRRSGRAFASDALALALAQEAVAQGQDKALDKDGRQFLYMPYMHSESLAVHDEALRLFETLGNDALEYEKKHREVLLQFGRYPMRNAALARTSTAAELAYIAERGGNMF